MNYLIIYAHPNRNSLNSSILDETESILKAKQDANIKLLDLYAKKFDPCLFFDSDNPRRNLDTREETKNYRDAIAWANHLIFIYPIWWGRPPAILLGFIDKVFVSGFAYQKSPKSVMPEGLLKKKVATIITTQSGPSLITRIMYHDTHRILIKRQVLNFCGIKKVRFFEISQSESMNNQKFNQLKLKLQKLWKRS